jgi:hypothetical protein
VIYRLGKKISNYYAAQDTVTGLYLQVRAYNYDPGNLVIQSANWVKNVARLDKSKNLAEMIINDLPKYWMDAIQHCEYRIRRIEATMKTPTNGWYNEYEQLLLNNEMEQIETYRMHLRNHPPKLLLVEVNTSVTSAPA